MSQSISKCSIDLLEAAPLFTTILPTSSAILPTFPTILPTTSTIPPANSASPSPPQPKRFREETIDLVDEMISKRFKERDAEYDLSFAELNNKVCTQAMQIEELTSDSIS